MDDPTRNLAATLLGALLGLLAFALIIFLMSPFANSGGFG